MPSRLFLLDGTGLFYRSFFAIKGLSTRDGTPTNAVFGFIRAIHQAIAVWKPTHFAVAWDGGTPVERLSLLPEYKAQRPPMPEALKRQEQPTGEFLERAGIPLIRMPRQEADDVLASLVQWSRGGADEVLVATGDKDLYQIVDDRVQLVSPTREEGRMGPREVMGKTGVKPERIVEWLALTGDSVDNIPGVPGCGPKTAAKLLNEFGGLSELWEHLDAVEPGRIRESLRSARAQVARNVSLVTLRVDLECSPGWEALRLKPESDGNLRPFYERMEFHSFLKESAQPLLL